MNLRSILTAAVVAAVVYVGMDAWKAKSGR